MPIITSRPWLFFILGSDNGSNENDLQLHTEDVLVPIDTTKEGEQNIGPPILQCVRKGYESSVDEDDGYIDESISDADIAALEELVPVEIGSEDDIGLPPQLSDSADLPLPDINDQLGSEIRPNTISSFDVDKTQVGIPRIVLPEEREKADISNMSTQSPRQSSGVNQSTTQVLEAGMRKKRSSGTKNGVQTVGRHQPTGITVYRRTPTPMLPAKPEDDISDLIAQGLEQDEEAAIAQIVDDLDSVPDFATVSLEMVIEEVEEGVGSDAGDTKKMVNAHSMLIRIPDSTDND